MRGADALIAEKQAREAAEAAKAADDDRFKRIQAAVTASAEQAARTTHQQSLAASASQGPWGGYDRNIYDRRP